MAGGFDLGEQKGNELPEMARACEGLSADGNINNDPVK
jgi:hypothetical protein